MAHLEGQRSHTGATETASRPGSGGGVPASGAALNPLLAEQRANGNLAVQRLLRTGALSPRHIVGQQRTLGNQAVQRLLRAHGGPLAAPTLQRQPAVIQREPGDTANLTRLRELLDDDEESDAITLMGQLGPDEVTRVLGSASFRSLATDAFDNDEMARAMSALRGGSLLQKLTWMEDEGTNWTAVKNLIRATNDPNQRTALYGNNTMRALFVDLCNNREMAEAVDLLGGTLLQKLTWMAAEGSSWDLVRPRIVATTDLPQRTALYGVPAMKTFFMDVCDNAEMADAVGLLGGTLAQQLDWMRAEGANWTQVKARLQATPDLAQRTALYGAPGMRAFFVDLCDNAEMAEAVDLLGGTLAQQLDWMREEGANWTQVRGRVTATTDANQKTALYGAAAMRALFVDVCNNREMAEAVDLLGGTLLQKLTWMADEGSDWALTRAKIVATADANQKTALYADTTMRDFFVDICNNAEMAEAVGLLGGTLLQKLRWLLAEGTDAALLQAPIQAASPTELREVSRDGAAMELLRAELTGDYAVLLQAIEGLGAGAGATGARWTEADRTMLATQSARVGVIESVQAARVVPAINALSPGDYTSFRALLTSAGSDTERAFLCKALAAGRSLADITTFAGTIRGLTDNWLIRNLNVVSMDDLTQAGIIQQYGNSCGPTSVQILHAQADPIYALALRSGGSITTAPNQAVSNPASITNPVVANEQSGILSAHAAAGTGVAPMDRATPGPGAWVESNMNAIGNATGVTYSNRIIPSGISVELAISVLVANLADNIHVPITVGGAEGQTAHYVVVMLSSGDRFQVHDVATGTTVWRTQAQFRSNTLSLPSGWNFFTSIDVPTRVPPRAVPAPPSP